MIIVGNWEHILLDGNSTIGYRVKRRVAGAPPPPIHSSGSKPATPPMSDNWHSDPAPAQYQIGRQTFVFGFWSVTASDPQSGGSSAQIQTAPIANDSHNGGQWTIQAKAYYIPVGSGGPSRGDGGALFLDAFDIQVGDFIPDDFVDVHPDSSGTLTAMANNGFLDTNANIAAGNPPPALTVTARDLLPGKQFAYWLYWPGNSALFHGGNPSLPPAVGTPNPHDIVLHHNDVLFAIGLYNEVPPPPPPPPITLIPGLNTAAYDWLWWWRTHGGVIDPPLLGDPYPWLRQFAAAAALAGVANQVSPELTRRVLEVALEEISIAASTLKQKIGSLPQK